MRHTVIVDAQNAGRRLDAYVRQLLPEVSLGTLMKWMRKGAVRVGGKKVKPNYRLQAGDEISLPGELDRTSTSTSTSTVDLRVVYEDEDLLVVDKPAGLPSQPGSGHDDSLVDRVLAYLGKENALPGHKPGLVGRLDIDVSGLVPIGKHRLALQPLAEAASAAIDKRYVALVLGQVTKPGTVELALEVGDAPTGKKTTPSPDGKTAYTEYTPLEALAEATLIELRLGTGRTHQIRAHMAAIGHPLLGDERYGNDATQRLARACGLPRVFLHAQRLHLVHPTSGKPLELEAPLPPDLARSLNRLRQETPASRRR